MKFDKDVLIKQRFWVGVVLTIPLILAGIVILTTRVSADIATKRGLLDKALDGAKKLQGPYYNADVIKKKAEEADKAQKQQNTVWKEAYDVQASILTLWPDEVERRFEFANGLFATEVQIQKTPAKADEWPEDKDNLVHGILTSLDRDDFYLKDRHGKEVRLHRFEGVKINATEEAGGGSNLNFPDLGGYKEKFAAVTYQQGKYFNDRLTDSEQIEYARSYKRQLQPILSLVDPMDRNGKGVMQFAGWTYDAAEETPPAGAKFLNFVPLAWKTEADISDEAWIAQEDLWVQREIYGLIRTANDSIGKFARIKGKETDKTQTYQNPYLELELTLAGADKLQVKVTNRLERRMKVDQQEFLVRFHKTLDPEKIKLSGLPLEPAGQQGSSRTEEINLGPRQNRPAIFSVDQALTWETAAVKRIDQISIGSADASNISHSQRTFPVGLKPLKEEEKKEEAKGAAPGAGPGGPGGPGIMPPAAGGFNPGGGQGGANAKTLPNGLNPDRYLEVTAQARRIPVAVALIIDQDHVDRVLTSFNNSRLRFLPTQVLLNHYPQSLKPQLLDNPQGGGSDGPFRPMGAGAPPMGGFLPPTGPMAPRPGLLAPGPMGAGGSDAAGAGGSPDLEANLEIVIYGIVTLYERYPPRPTPAPAASTDKK